MSPARPGRRYTVDSNLFIDAVRTERGFAELNAFHTAYAPFEHLSAVVVQELRAGVTGRAATILSDSVFLPFERRGRIFAPTYSAWKECGRVLAELVRPDGWRSIQRSFVNDVLLAASCRESGMVLVTKNLVDFGRIAAVCPFDFVAPWPTTP